MGMKFDGTVSMGHLLTLLAMMLGGTAGYTSIMVSIAEIKKDIVFFQADIDYLTDKIGRLDERIRRLELDGNP